MVFKAGKTLEKLAPFFSGWKRVRRQPCTLHQGTLNGMAGTDDAEVALGKLVDSECTAMRSDLMTGLIQAHAIAGRLLPGGIAGPRSRLGSVLNFDLCAEIEAVIDCVGFHGRNRTPK